MTNTEKATLELVATTPKAAAPVRPSKTERAARKLARLDEQFRIARARQRTALNEQASRLGFALIEACRKDPEFRADVLQSIEGAARAELLSIFANGL